MLAGFADRMWACQQALYYGLSLGWLWKMLHGPSVLVIWPRGLFSFESDELLIISLWMNLPSVSNKICFFLLKNG